jgi:hypothetical protein
MLGGVQLVLGGKWPGVSVTDRVRRVVPIKAAAGPKEEEHGRCLGIVALRFRCLSWNDRRKLYMYFSVYVSSQSATAKAKVQLPAVRLPSPIPRPAAA